MKDKAGQLYTAIGGIVVGAGSGALVSGATTGFTGWLLPVGIGASATTAIGLYLMLATIGGFWLPGRKSTLAVVVETAHQLSMEISIWAGDFRSVSEPRMVPAELWDHETDRILRQGSDLVAKWNTRFAVRAVTIFDQLMAHGADDLTQFGRYGVEHPTNLLGVEDVGRALGQMAARLEAKKAVRF